MLIHDATYNAVLNEGFDESLKYWRLVYLLRVANSDSDSLASQDAIACVERNLPECTTAQIVEADCLLDFEFEAVTDTMPVPQGKLIDIIITGL